MGSSAKKKKEKAKDFAKPKLKVGKRPTNTNATSTSFTAKSIVIKQQSLSESTRDSAALFNHQLSLLTSRNETQRRDALAYLTTYATAHQELPQSPSVILAKALPLVLDGNSAIRSQLLKLVRTLPANDLGSLDSPLLYIRAGLTHLSTDIRLHALDMLDWLLAVRGTDLVSIAGGWVKLLNTFQILLSWEPTAAGKWSNTKSASTTGSSKLVVHQLNTLATLLSKGLAVNQTTETILDDFPYWHQSAHRLPPRSNVYGYLNLFGKPRDNENEMYESTAERREVFHASGLYGVFQHGIEEAKTVGGETGRAAAGIAKVLKHSIQD